MGQNKRQLIVVGLVIGEIGLIILFYNWLLNRPKTSKPLTPSITPKSANCSRNTPYPMQPEFSRVISLLNQRYTEHNDPRIDTYRSMTNCYSIEYAELADAEGVFYFDKNTSSADKLVIKVDKDYKSYDDLSTAFLLAHELTHARQFVDFLLSNDSGNCVDQEAEAFYQQLRFGAVYLNGEESRSIISRAEKRSNTNTQLSLYAELLDISWNTLQTCQRLNKTSEQVTRCYSNKLSDNLRAWISQNPGYKKQCGL